MRQILKRERLSHNSYKVIYDYSDSELIDLMMSSQSVLTSNVVLDCILISLISLVFFVFSYLMGIVLGYGSLFRMIVYGILIFIVLLYLLRQYYNVLKNDIRKNLQDELCQKSKDVIDAYKVEYHLLKHESVIRVSSIRPKKHRHFKMFNYRTTNHLKTLSNSILVSDDSVKDECEHVKTGGKSQKNTNRKARANKKVNTGNKGVSTSKVQNKANSNSNRHSDKNGMNKQKANNKGTGKSKANKNSKSKSKGNNKSNFRSGSSVGVHVS